MKMVVAFIQPFMESRVMAVLHQMPEVSGATFDVVRGFGRGRLKRDGDQGLITSIPKVRLEIVVADEALEKVCEAIQVAAHTGKTGDGKIFVLPVARAVRISTGEQGDRAI